MGDFNLPYNQQNSPSFKKMKSFESKFGFRQLISKPTRCNVHTVNILDLIFTNSCHILHSDTWETLFSDLQPIYSIRKKARSKTPRVSFRCLSFNNFVREDLQTELMNYNWTPLFDTTCPEQPWLLFYGVIHDIANKHCPYKAFTSRKELPPAQLTREILEYLKEHDH